MVLSIVAAATLFIITFDLGLTIVPGEFRWLCDGPPSLCDLASARASPRSPDSRCMSQSRRI